MAGLTTSTKQGMLDYLRGQAAYLSLHSADPGATGTNELTGGSPAYARKGPTSWTAANPSSPTALPTFDVPAGSTVAYLGYWTAVSGGTFIGSRPLSATETYTGQGTYTPTSVSESVA